MSTNTSVSAATVLLQSSNSFLKETAIDSLEMGDDDDDGELVGEVDDEDDCDDELVYTEHVGKQAAENHPTSNAANVRRSADTTFNAYHTSSPLCASTNAHSSAPFAAHFNETQPQRPNNNNSSTHNVAISNNKSYHRRPKPPFSYVQLIAMAIRSTPSGRPTLQDINDYLKCHFEFFRGDYNGWKNSIRHNLSLNDCFRKILRDPARPWGKDNYWMLNPQSEDYVFDEKGVMRRKRKRVSPRQPTHHSHHHRHNAHNSDRHQVRFKKMDQKEQTKKVEIINSDKSSVINNFAIDSLLGANNSLCVHNVSSSVSPTKISATASNPVIPFSCIKNGANLPISVPWWLTGMSSSSSTASSVHKPCATTVTPSSAFTRPLASNCHALFNQMLLSNGATHTPNFCASQNWLPFLPISSQVPSSIAAGASNQQPASMLPPRDQLTSSTTENLFFSSTTSANNSYSSAAAWLMLQQMQQLAAHNHAAISGQLGASHSGGAASSPTWPSTTTSNQLPNALSLAQCYAQFLNASVGLPTFCSETPTKPLTFPALNVETTKLNH